jgi:hypothetical protein
MDASGANGKPLAKNVKRLGHLDLPGAGQVYVAGEYAYIGHLPNKPGLGTSVVDVSDPTRPKVVASIDVGDAESHSHKVRVVDGIMAINVERNNFGIGRKAEQLPPVKKRLGVELGREPSDKELAAKLGVEESDIAALEASEIHQYTDGGFKLFDASDPANPREIAYHKTGGIGVHRFDMDSEYAYISTEMDGFIGNILVIYDIRDPEKPQEVSRWWMDGQNIDAGEIPTWEGRECRLHHAMRQGDRLWAGVWQAGLRVIDISDITKPITVGSYNYHPPYPEPSHTFMPVPFPVAGRDIALAMDEEDQYYSPREALARRGRPHANLWLFDVGDIGDIKPLAIYQASEAATPWAETRGTRFGAHQFQEHFEDTMVYCAWFSGGLRIVDIADPLAPREVGFYIPEPVKGAPAPQTNDVDTDSRGLVYIVDRFTGFDILEFDRP